MTTISPQSLNQRGQKEAMEIAQVRLVQVVSINS